MVITAVDNSAHISAFLRHFCQVVHSEIVCQEKYIFLCKADYNMLPVVSFHGFYIADKCIKRHGVIVRQNNIIIHIFQLHKRWFCSFRENRHSFFVYCVNSVNTFVTALVIMGTGIKGIFLLQSVQQEIQPVGTPAYFSYLFPAQCYRIKRTENIQPVVFAFIYSFPQRLFWLLTYIYITFNKIPCSFHRYIFFIPEKAGNPVCITDFSHKGIKQPDVIICGWQRQRQYYLVSIKRHIKAAADAVSVKQYGIGTCFPPFQTVVGIRNTIGKVFHFCNILHCKCLVQVWFMYFNGHSHNKHLAFILL